MFSPSAAFYDNFWKLFLWNNRLLLKYFAYYILDLGSNNAYSETVRFHTEADSVARFREIVPPKRD